MSLSRKIKDNIKENVVVDKLKEIKNHALADTEEVVGTAKNAVGRHREKKVSKEMGKFEREEKNLHREDVIVSSISLIHLARKIIHHHKSKKIKKHEAELKAMHDRQLLQAHEKAFQNNSPNGEGSRSQAANLYAILQQDPEAQRLFAERDRLLNEIEPRIQALKQVSNEMAMKAKTDREYLDTQMNAFNGGTQTLSGQSLFNRDTSGFAMQNQTHAGHQNQTETTAREDHTYQCQQPTRR